MDIELANKQIKIKVYELDISENSFPSYMEGILKCEIIGQHYDIHEYVKNYVFKVYVNDKKYIICNFNKCEQNDDPINKIITCMCVNDYYKTTILNHPVKYILNNRKKLNKIKNKIEIHKAVLTLYTDFMDTNKETFYDNNYYKCGGIDIESDGESDSNNENDYFISYNNTQKMIKTLANMLIKNDKNIEFL